MYYIQDFPTLGQKTKITLYTNKDDKQKNAFKAFKMLSKEMNFDDNNDGQIYLRFWMSDDNGNVYPYIGTRIKFEQIKYGKNNNGNEIVIRHRNVVSEYEKDFDNMFYPEELIGGKKIKINKKRYNKK